MKESQEAFFFGGIDTDSTERTIAQGDYRLAYYARSGNAAEGEDNALVSMIGNLLVENTSLPAGNNVIIGSCPWVEENAVMVFVHNSNNDHAIFKYNIEAQTFEAVIIDELLNFQLTNLIYGARVINGILYWTDGYFLSYLEDGDGILQFNPPRMINIQKAIDGDYTIDFQLLDFVKWPSYEASTATEFDEVGLSNKLYGSLYQFVTQWVYENGEESVWSPISKLNIPQSWEFISGRNYLTPNSDNTINLEVPTGSSIVKSLRVAVRNLNTGQFGIFQELDKATLGIADDTTYPVVFQNNVAIKPLGLGETLRGYDRVPQVAYDLESLPTKQICFANFVEGYDPIELDASAEYVMSEIRNTVLPVCTFKFGSNGATAGSPISLWGITTPTIFALQEGDILSIEFPTTITRTLSYTISEADITAVSGLSATDAYIYILNTIGDEYASQLTTLGYTLTTTDATGITTIGTGYQIDITSETLDVYASKQCSLLVPTRPQKSLKKGARHEFGIQYYDRALRSGGVQTVNELTIQVPFPSQETFPDFVDTHSPYTVIPRITINNDPPEWAAYWMPVVRKITGIRDFQQRTGIDLQTDPAYPNLYKISLDTFYENTYGANINQQIQVGDIVRFVTVSASFVSTLPAYAQGYTEVQVQRYETGGGSAGGEAIWVTKFDYQTIVDETGGFLMEIYTPNKEALEEPWFEIGEVKRVLNPYTPERTHEGDSYTIRIVTQAGIGGDTWEVEGNLVGLVDVGYTLTFTPLVGTPLVTTATSVTYNVADNTTTIVTANTATLASYLTMTFDTSQTSTLPLTIDLDFGDVYVRPRISNRFAGNFNVSSLWRYYVEDPSVSDYYLSRASDYGRIAIENPKFKRREMTVSGIHGGAYIDGSLNNNLCSFDFNLKNTFTLDEQFGSIQRIIINGYTLKVLQDRKETSVYIQRAYAVQGDGSVQVTEQSSDTFASIRPYESLNGTIHKASVRVQDGNLFYYDYHSGMFVMSSNNGQVDLSDDKFKFNKETYDITNLVGEGGWTVQSGINSFNNEYRIYFTNGEITKGYVFNYRDGRWKTFVDYFPEWTENLGYNSFEFKDGELYISDKGDNLNFFGEDKSFIVQFPFNANPNYMKNPLNIGLRMNVQPLSLICDVASQASYPAMRTTMSSFKLYENGFWAGMLRDELNVVAGVPYLATTDLARVNGRVIKCYSMLERVEAEGTDKIILFSAKTNYTPSESVE